MLWILLPLAPPGRSMIRCSISAWRSCDLSRQRAASSSQALHRMITCLEPPNQPLGQESPLCTDFEPPSFIGKAPGDCDAYSRFVVRCQAAKLHYAPRQSTRMESRTAWRIRFLIQTLSRILRAKSGQNSLKILKAASLLRLMAPRAKLAPSSVFLPLG